MKPASARFQGAAASAGQVVELLAPWLQANGIGVRLYLGHRAFPLAPRAFLDIVREVSEAD